MPEYIDKANLYKKIAELEELARNRYLDTPSNSPAYPRYMAQLDERTRLKHMVADFPSADVAEVKHGKWMKEDKGFGRDITTLHLMHVYKYICPLCGYYTDNQASRFNFCPNCGATMDGEE